MNRIRRSLAVAGLAAVLGAGLGGCAGSVTKDDVASAIGGKLTEQGVTATGVTCPDDLPAEVAKSVRCEYVVDGKPVGVTATVTSLQGDQANFDVVSEAPLVGKAEVAEAIDEQLTAQGIPSDGPTTCPGSLIGENGRTLRCEFSAGGQPVDAVATVTSVAGDQANFDISTEARPIAKQLLNQKVAEQVATELQTSVDGADCEGDLAAEVGESVICTVSGGGESIDLQVSVTSVDGGLINYQLELV
jgi:hypothetical protein